MSHIPQDRLEGLQLIAGVFVVNDFDATTTFSCPDDLIYVYPTFTYDTTGNATFGLRCHDDCTATSAVLVVDPVTKKCSIQSIDAGMDWATLVWILGRLSMCVTSTGTALGKFVVATADGQVCVNQLINFASQIENF